MDILVAIDMGKTVGLEMMQSLQSIAVINGMPSMYGDAPLAVCQSHPYFEWIKEEPLTKGSEIDGYKCTVKRRNNEEHTVIFSVSDAKKAGLWGKQGPWSQYPSRMLQMRARGFSLRNTFPDALKGIQIAEEIQDIQVIEGNWSPKQSQQEKMNNLLTKKGLNNAGKTINSENYNNNTDANIFDSDGVVFNADFNLAQSNSKSNVHQELAEAGEQENSIADKKNGAGKCSEEQLESINFLVGIKKVDKSGQLKCLDHFGMTDFSELTYAQAESVIKKLNSMDEPE
jgi:hypothetical protein